MEKLRILNFKKDYLATKPNIRVQRAQIFTESCRQSEGMPVIVQRAKAFNDVCNKMDISIFPEELIVGNIGEFKRSGIICPEYSWQLVDKEMNDLETRTDRKSVG